MNMIVTTSSHFRYAIFFVSENSRLVLFCEDVIRYFCYKSLFSLCLCSSFVIHYPLLWWFYLVDYIIFLLPFSEEEKWKKKLTYTNFASDLGSCCRGSNKQIHQWSFIFKSYNNFSLSGNIYDSTIIMKKYFAYL